MLTSKYFALALPIAKLKARITLESDKKIFNGSMPHEANTIQKMIK
jgi:hypothetical protein